jgi:hypothetical protein
VNGSLEAPPIVIRHSRIKHALWFLACGMVAAGCIKLLLSGTAKNPGAIWLLIAVFLPMALVALGFVLYPAQLTLDKAGVKVEMLWKEWAFAWSDFSAFEVGFFTRYFHKADFRLSDTCPKERRTTLVGSRRTFGAMWEMSPTRLVHVLTEAKGKWGG